MLMVLISSAGDPAGTGLAPCGIFNGLLSPSFLDIITTEYDFATTCRTVIATSRN